ETGGGSIWSPKGCGSIFGCTFPAALSLLLQIILGLGALWHLALSTDHHKAACFRLLVAFDCAVSFASGGVMTKIFTAVIFALPLLMVGCIDYYPSASAPFGVLPNDGNFHEKRVVTELQCEISDFLNRHPTALDPKSTAVGSVIYETDVSGYLNFVGVDLSKIGFTSLAQLVSISNKVPTLGAKTSSKGTNIWQVDFVLAQKQRTDFCASTRDRFPPILRFDIDKWLEKFFSRINDDRPIYLSDDANLFPTQVSNINGTCLKTITIKLAFQLIVDV